MSVPLTGQVAVSGTAQQLDSGSLAAACAQFIIRAPASNAAAVFIGGPSVTSGTGFQLDAGTDVTYERLSQNGQPAYQLKPSDFYAVGTSPDVVTWLASP